MSLETIDKEYIGQVLLNKGFRTWFLYMFRIINGKPFIVEPIHKDMFDLFQNILDRKILRHNLNVPPRSAKTTCCKYLIAYAYAKNPKCNFIYTSYSQSLLADIANDIIGILEHPVYKAMYPQIDFAVENNQIQPVDEFWRDYFISNDKEKKNIYSTKKIITYAGGVCWFASLGSQLTGVGCFDYNTIVHTDKGIIKIGDIVENKKEVKILSYDFTSKKRIYKPIDRYIKNEKSHFIKIILNNGETINCTPDHLFYLQNGQSIIASGLKIGDKLFSESSNPLYLTKMKIKHFCNILSSVIFIKDKANFTNRISFKNIINFTPLLSLVSKPFCYFSPNKTAFNIRNRRCRNVIIFGNFLICSFIFGYIYCLTGCEFHKFSILEKLIVSVGLSCAIFQIFKRIIGWIRIFVSDFKICRTFTNKSKQNKRMNGICFPFSIVKHKTYSFITFFYGLLFKNLVRFFAKNFPRFTDIISGKIRDVIVVDIVKCNHITPSYCVSVRDTNNLFIGKSQQLIHNCGTRGSQEFSGGIIIDDGDKPADIHSEIMREKTHKYFSETLLSRLNDSNAFILNVQQRLHTEDLTGFLSEVYGYKSLVKPLFDDGVLQIPSQYSEERIFEIKKDDAVFSAQYQQEPVPETGMLIHTDKFKPYDVPPQTFDLLYICCDTAFSEKKSADNSAFMLMGVKGHERYILDLYCKKVDFVNLRKDLKEFYNKALAVYGQYNNFSSIYIEAKASGISLIQQLRSEGLPVQEIYPTVHNNLLKKDEVKDKLTRFYEVQADIESGYVNIPASAPWLKDFIKECLAFTGGKQNSKDDRVDSFLYCLKVARKNTQTDWEAFARAFS